MFDCERYCASINWQVRCSCGFSGLLFVHKKFTIFFYYTKMSLYYTKMSLYYTKMSLKFCV